MQRETAAGDDVRQAAVLLQEFVKVQIVVAHDELGYSRPAAASDIGGIGLSTGYSGPQIHLNGLPSVFLHLSRSAFQLHPVSRDTPSTSAI